MSIPPPAAVVHEPITDIHHQVQWSRLLAVVEEQARVLMRTAFSAVVRESGDLSAGVFDTAGRMLAQAETGTPGHVNAMAQAVQHFIARFPVATMGAGDHFITNDPWLASGHLHDVTVVTPAVRRGRVIALIACTCHQLDIGGRGQGPDGRSVYEEGLFIPLLRLAERGRLNDTLFEILRSNVRTPAEVEGDILSYMTSNDAAALRLNEMLDEFGLESLAALADYVLARSRAGMLAAIAALPRGEFRHRLVLDGYGEPIELACALRIDADRILVDYAGSSAASSRGINVVLNYCKAYSAYGVRSVVAPAIPNNAGSLEPISVAAPRGSILNVERPWPVSARHIIGQFLPDVVMGCLAQAVPDRVPAEGASCVWGAQLRGGPEVAAGRADIAGQRFDVIFFNSGGSGARRGLDGLSATAFPSGVRAMPIEVIESVAPVVLWTKELRPDSAGAGRTRGGYGQIVEVGTVDGAPFEVAAMFDRVRHGARGRAGGLDGAAGVVALASGAALAAMGVQVIPANARLRLELPGGGGYGPPADREPARVAAEIRDGLLTPAAAQRDYGASFAASDPAE